MLRGRTVRLSAPPLMRRMQNGCAERNLSETNSGVGDLFLPTNDSYNKNVATREVTRSRFFLSLLALHMKTVRRGGCFTTLN